MVVNGLTKYAHFVALKYPYTTISVVKAFVNNVVRLHGTPSLIVSDRDKVFLSSFWQKLFKLQGTKLSMSSSYHPQTYRQTEIVNRTVGQYLRCFVGEQPKHWMQWLSWAEFSYNTSIHSSTKVSPFEALYGVPSPSLLSYISGTTQVQAVNDYLCDRETILKDLRYHLNLARNRMKCQADQHRRELNFKEKDYSSVVTRRSQKLAARFFGPYQVIENVGHVTYRLALPPGSLIHDVFYVSLLKKHHGSLPKIELQTPPNPTINQVLSQPEAVLDRRLIRKGNYRSKPKFLIKWKHALVEDSTREDQRRFSRMYPNFVLVDNDILRVGK
ncbi:hypothetical protein ACOSQ3_004700 [Xanthoceras sorbifolium]